MNESRPLEIPSSAAPIVLSVWHSLSSFAAVTENAVILWLLYKNKSLRTISNRFLASLSVADFSVGLFVGPVWIVIRHWTQSPFDVIKVLWLYSTAAIAFNICCVSVDRFIAVRFPFRYQEIVTKKRCHTVIILVWLFSLGLPFSRLSVKDGDKINVIVLCISLACITFVIPILVVSCSYIFIFESAKKQLHRILARESPTIYNDNFKVRTMLNLKAMKTIGFVLIACIITWIPSLVLLLVDCYYTAKKQQWKKD